MEVEDHVQNSWRIWSLYFGSFEEDIVKRAKKKNWIWYFGRLQWRAMANCMGQEEWNSVYDTEYIRSHNVKSFFGMEGNACRNLNSANAVGVMLNFAVDECIYEV